jgi:hypothetical protein
MTLTVEELLARARSYWPADLEWLMRGEDTPETARRFALWDREVQQRGGEWYAMLADLRQDLPGFGVHMVTAPSDTCFSCSVYPPKEQKKPPLVQLVVGCMSMIAPVYIVYGLQYEYRPRKRPKFSNHQLFFDELPPELRGPADAVARRIEARFGASRLPPEIAATPVPLCVDIICPPHATLFHALFTTSPESIP